MPLSSRFEEALAYASEAHRGQFRKGTQTPYVAHLLTVCATVLEHGADEDEAIAALLHDAVEDAGGLSRLEDIRERFGERVASIVRACTDAWDFPKPPWRERKEHHIACVRHADASVLLVTAADKLHNTRSIARDVRARGPLVWELFKGRKEGMVWYHRAMLDALREAWAEAGSPPRLERLLLDLEAAVDDLSTLA